MIWPVYWWQWRLVMFRNSPVSRGSYSDWNACLSMSAFPPDYKNSHSLNFPFPPAMALRPCWSQSSSRHGFGYGLQRAEGHCVEAQRYVAESSGWDPLMYMELQSSLIFRVTLTRPCFFSSPFTLITNKFLVLFAGSHLYPCKAQKELEGKLQVKLVLSSS